MLFLDNSNLPRRSEMKALYVRALLLATALALVAALVGEQTVVWGN
jgi:hypothetical protein